MQKAGLEGEIARLERQRAAHFDGQLAVRRRTAEAQHEIETAQRRVEQIGRDLEQRVPTRGDAFLLVAGERRIEDRHAAGAFLLNKVRLIEKSRAETDIRLGALGGFELACEAGPTWRQEFQAGLILRRSGFDQEIETEHDMTPMGLIARIEHIQERMPQERQAQNGARAKRSGGCSVSRPSRPALRPQPELDSKKAGLAALEADLAATAKPPLAKAA